MLNALLVPALVGMLQWICQVDPAKCNGCMNCIQSCNMGAISMHAGNAWIDPELCTGCDACLPYCPMRAIYRVWWEDVQEGSVAAPALTCNPAAGHVSVRGVASGTNVRLFALSGRLARETSASSEGNALLELSGLPPGVYLVSSDQGFIAALTVMGPQ
ncbi:MAG: 4Fe-4S binding protein [Candidatus Fermentibacteraceae bacterium]